MPRGGAKYNLFVQPDEPKAKDGIWIKTEEKIQIDSVSAEYIGNGKFIRDTSFSIPSSDFTGTGKIVMRHKDNAGKDCVYFLKDANYAGYPLQKYSFADNVVTNFSNATPAELVSAQVRAAVFYSDKLYFFNTTASYSFDFGTETFSNLNFALGNKYIKYGYALVENCVYMLGYDGICYKYNLDTLTLSQFNTGITNTGYINKVFPCGTDVYVICATDTGDNTASWAGYALDTKTDTVIQLDMTDSNFFKSSTVGWYLGNIFPIMDKIGVVTGASGSPHQVNLSIYNKRSFAHALYTKRSESYEGNSIERFRYLPFKCGAILPNSGSASYFCGARTDVAYFPNEDIIAPEAHYFYNGSIYTFCPNCSTQWTMKLDLSVTKESGKNKLILFDGGFTPVRLIKNSDAPFLIGGCVLCEGENVINDTDMYIGTGETWIKFENDFPRLQIVRNSTN